MHHPPKPPAETVRIAVESSDLVELVDAIVEAVDTDRADQIHRVRAALEHFNLAETFTDELRLSGVPSATWQRCEFCGEVIDDFETSKEAA